MSTPTNEADILLTPQQAADMLQIKKQTLDQWRSRGNHELAFVRVGKRIRYPLLAIREYIKSRLVTRK